MDTFRLAQISLVEFADIVTDAYPVGRKLRLLITDDGFLDVWHSGDARDRYKYHWMKDEHKGIIYRHDNTPDARWKHLSSYPKHFHNGSEYHVIESFLSDRPEQALREFLVFVRKRMAP